MFWIRHRIRALCACELSIVRISTASRRWSWVRCVAPRRRARRVSPHWPVQVRRAPGHRRRHPVRNHHSASFHFFSLFFKFLLFRFVARKTEGEKEREGERERERESPFAGSTRRWASCASAAWRATPARASVPRGQSTRGTAFYQILGE